MSNETAKCNTNQCQLYKNNSKTLWQLINKSIGKTSNKTCVIEKLRVGNIEFVEPKDIADELCHYYSQIGVKLSKSITKLTTDKLSHLKKIPRNARSLFLTLTTRYEIIKIIDNLPNKKSSGHDKLNNLLLKCRKKMRLWYQSITDPFCYYSLSQKFLKNYIHKDLQFS